jgi:hypothetical protein
VVDVKFESYWNDLELMAASGKGACCLDGNCYMRAMQSPGFRNFVQNFRKFNIEDRHFCLNMLIGPSVIDGLGKRQVVQYRLPLVNQVCRTAFCKLLGMSKHVVEERVHDLRMGNVIPTPHGLTHRRSNHSYNTDALASVRAFFLALAQRFGEKVQGPAVRDEIQNLVLLPASFSVRVLHRIYAQWCLARNRDRIARQLAPISVVSHTSLLRIWRTSPELKHVRRIHHKPKRVFT